MENYLMLDGKKVVLSKETVNNLKKEPRDDQSKYLKLIISKDVGDYYPFMNDEGETTGSVQIGRGSVPDEYKGKCLLVHGEYIPKILPNKEDSFGDFPYMVVFEKVKG